MRTVLETARAVAVVRNMTCAIREAGGVPVEFAAALAMLNAACAQVHAKRRAIEEPEVTVCDD